MGQIKIILTLIRHGQVPGNIDRRFVGVTNEPLTPEGAASIRERASMHCYPKADILLVSPMLRCLQTADIIYPGKKQIVIDDLKEMNFGIFENKNHAELDGRPEYQAWLDQGGRADFPCGEPTGVFCERIMRGLAEAQSICEKYGADNDLKVVNASMIVHGGTIMAIQAGLGICDFYDKMFDNGDFRTIELTQYNWQS